MWHAIMHVHTVLLQTFDLTNCQTYRKDTLQDPQQVHSQILILLLPCTSQPTSL